MTSASLIALSPTVERASIAVAAALVLLLAMLAILRGRDAGAARNVDGPLPRRIELALLAMVLVYGAFVRLIGWNDLITPPFYFSEVPQLQIARTLEQQTVWPTWVHLLRTYQVGWTHQSAIVMPVLAALQRALGASFGLPVLLGAIFGITSIILAWLLGRALRSQVFGLTFAAFVACSPLQISWSRLGGFFIAAAPQVLLAMLCGYLAGRRRSLVLTIVAGLVAWTSLYHYYAARVAMPLAGAALLRGCQDARASWRRLLVLAILFVATIGGVFLALEAGASGRSVFWPTYLGYVGNRGEQSLVEMVTRNVAYVREQGGKALQAYFLRLRTGRSGAWNWGMEHGGLVLEPLAVLGAVGLLVSLWRIRREWLWLLMLLVGFALPSMSAPTARRFLVMDLAWCALAANGLLALTLVLGRGVSRRTAAALAGGTAGAIALWSAATVFALDDTLPHVPSQSIPFGESGFFDGITCRRCAEAGKEWQRDIADGAFVVLFDSDSFRENRTSPGGLPAYGKLAALAAGTPDRFVSAYGLMGNWDVDPPAAGVVYSKVSTTFPDVLRVQMEQSEPSRIVWHFERPTPWELWLVRRLIEAGGTARAFPTPLATQAMPTGLQVVTPWSAREPAFAIMRELAEGTGRARDSKCIDLAPRGVAPAPEPAFLVTAPPTGTVDGRPAWITGGYHQVGYEGRLWSFEMPTGAALDDSKGRKTLDVVAGTGNRALIDVESGHNQPAHLPHGLRPGLDCAARLGSHWWVVDFTSGNLQTSAPDPDWVPRMPWMGITRGPGGTLVLASADQTIVVLDVEARRELTRFPARVSPSRRVVTDECAQVVAGDGWYATLNNLDSVLSVYDSKGRPLGMLRLDIAAALDSSRFSALGATGQYLGLGMWRDVKTMELTIDPSCGR